MLAILMLGTEVKSKEDFFSANGFDIEIILLWRYWWRLFQKRVVCT